MVVFPEESKFYTQWQHDMESRGVTVRLNTEIVAIPERSKDRVRVQLRGRRPQPDHHNPVGADQDLPVTEETYDEIVLCVLADTAKRLLGKTATFMEKKVLGMTKWSDDITVTHTVNQRRENRNRKFANSRWHNLGSGLHEKMVHHGYARERTKDAQRA